MPRFNINADDSWACFSSISSGFVTRFVSRKKFDEWRKKEYGNDVDPLERCNKMSLAEALRQLEFRNPAELCELLREVGLLAPVDFDASRVNPMSGETNATNVSVKVDFFRSGFYFLPEHLRDQRIGFSLVSRTFLTKLMPVKEYEQWQMTDEGKWCFPNGEKPTHQISLKQALLLFSVGKSDEEIYNDLLAADLLTPPITAED